MGLFDIVGETLFGSTGAPQNYFNKGLGVNYDRFLGRQLGTDPIDDPNLAHYLDSVMGGIDQQFDAEKAKFASTRKSPDAGDSVKFGRDLAVARSEAKQRAGTQLLLGLQAQRGKGVFEWISGKQDAAMDIQEFMESQRQANVGFVFDLAKTATGGNAMFDVFNPK